MKKLVLLAALTLPFFAHADYVQGDFGNILVKMDDNKATLIQSETWHCVANDAKDRVVKGAFGSKNEINVYDCPDQGNMRVEIGINNKLGQVTLTVLNNGQAVWNDTEDFSVLEQVKGDFK